jgi:anaerobic selenocysteine-containing dehydrogenase
MSVAAATWSQTACILCECNCGIEVQLAGRHLARIRGDRAHPGTHGYTCNKAMRLDHYQNGRHRLSSPLRRRPDGGFEEIDWDTAIREVVERCTAIRDSHGGESILYYGGGGQGNHLGGSYSGAFLRAMGSRHRSGALAQEKTGEAWVEHSLYGAHTRGEFESAEVSLFIGKNPWMSQSFPRARIVLREIAKDPERSMIVIDPVLTDTAKLADFHLRVRPGTDAWCLAAMVGVLVQEDLIDHEFLATHVTGAEPVLAACADVDVSRYAGYCGVDEELIRAASRRIAQAESVSAFEDLGVQQAPNSTLCSYINRLVWIMTGNFGNPGGMHLHTSFVNLFRDPRVRRTRVTGAPIIGGLVPYETLGPTLPPGLEAAAALWGLAYRCAMTYPDAVRRAGHADGNELFDAILNSPSGVVFTRDEYGDDFTRISHPDKRIALELPEMLAELEAIDTGPHVHTNERFPMILSVGERRSFTANDIFRDPGWRKQDIDGRLRVSTEDAIRLGLGDGERALVTTARGSAEAIVEVSEAMQAGHASLPNGFGLDYTGSDGKTIVAGVAPNSLTSSEWRDQFAGTPWHKHVPARIELARVAA